MSSAQSSPSVDEAERPSRPCSKGASGCCACLIEKARQTPPFTSATRSTRFAGIPQLVRSTSPCMMPKLRGSSSRLIERGTKALPAATSGIRMRSRGNRCDDCRRPGVGAPWRLACSTRAFGTFTTPSLISELAFWGHYTKVSFTYARGEPLVNTGECCHAARSDDGARSGRSWPGSGRLSTFQR